MAHDRRMSGYNVGRAVAALLCMGPVCIRSAKPPTGGAGPAAVLYSYLSIDCSANSRRIRAPTTPSEVRVAYAATGNCERCERLKGVDVWKTKESKLSPCVVHWGLWQQGSGQRYYQPKTRKIR